MGEFDVRGPFTTSDRRGEPSDAGADMRAESLGPPSPGTRKAPRYVLTVLPSLAVSSD